MRTLTAQATQVLAKNFRGEHLRVKIKDSGGTLRDLGSYPGFDAVESCSIEENIDGDHRTLTLQLKREVFDFSVAGLVADAPANVGFVSGGTYSPLVALRRMVTVEVALVPEDTALASVVSGDWIEMFRGYVDAIDDASGENVSVECRDQGAAVADAFIEKERAYGLGTTRGCRIFKSGETYVLNEYAIPSSTKLNGHYYKVTTAGTAAATEPTWPTGGASTVTSGSVTFTEQGATSTTGIAAHTLMQQLLDDNVGGVTLYTPSAPTWVIKPYVQERKPLLESLRDIAIQIGWDVRYAWRSGSSQFELTFSQPDRTKTTPDATITWDQYEDITSLRREIANIRNAVRVVYSDSADVFPDGTPKRKSIEVSDSTSITNYGRRFCEMAEDEASQIDTSTEATLFANAALSDLKEPAVTQEMSAFLFPGVELGDLIRFTANNMHYTADQDLAVTGLRHELSREQSRTTLSCRGKPAVANRRWLEEVALPDKRFPSKGAKTDDWIHRFQDLATTSAFTILAEGIVGGGRISKSGGTYSKDGVSSELEVHVSTSAGFTPSSATLVARGEQNEFELANLIPGTTYYVKAVPRGRNAGRIVRAEPTSEVSFVAGYAAPFHDNPDGANGLLLPNGDFAHWTLGSTVPPDRWRMLTGTWGTDVAREATTIYSGLYSLLLTGNSAITRFPSVDSEYVPIVAAHRYDIRGWLKEGNASSLGGGIGYAFSSTKSTGTVITSGTIATGTAGAYDWTEVRSLATAPAGAKWLRISCLGGLKGAANTQTYIDNVSVRDVEVEQETWTNATLVNSWTNFGAPFHSAGYFLDSMGTVHLRGLVTGGAQSAVLPIFTLPSGYRPTASEIFATVSNSALGRATVTAAGLVLPEISNPAWFSLDGITFRTY